MYFVLYRTLSRFGLISIEKKEMKEDLPTDREGDEKRSCKKKERINANAAFWDKRMYACSCTQLIWHRYLFVCETVETAAAAVAATAMEMCLSVYV